MNSQMRVYKALREVDPDGFTRVFNRYVPEYDEVAPPRWMAAAEYLLAGLLTLLLLGKPLVDPELTSLVIPGALLWLLLQLFAVSKGCSSIFAYWWNIHATQGSYQMCTSPWLLLMASFLEAAFLLLTVGLAAVPSVGFRLFTPSRQSVVEMLLRVVPLREVVRPMHFSPLSVPRYSRE